MHWLLHYHILRTHQPEADEREHLQQLHALGLTPQHHCEVRMQDRAMRLAARQELRSCVCVCAQDLALLLNWASNQGATKPF